MRFRRPWNGKSTVVRDLPIADGDGLFELAHIRAAARALHQAVTFLGTAAILAAPVIFAAKWALA